MTREQIFEERRKAFQHFLADLEEIELEQLEDDIALRRAYIMEKARIFGALNN